MVKLVSGSVVALVFGLLVLTSATHHANEAAQEQVELLTDLRASLR